MGAFTRGEDRAAKARSLEGGDEGFGLGRCVRFFRFFCFCAFVLKIAHVFMLFLFIIALPTTSGECAAWTFHVENSPNPDAFPSFCARELKTSSRKKTTTKKKNEQEEEDEVLTFLSGGAEEGRTVVLVATIIRRRVVVKPSRERTTPR